MGSTGGGGLQGGAESTAEHIGQALPNAQVAYSNHTALTLTHNVSMFMDAIYFGWENIVHIVQALLNGFYLALQRTQMCTRVRRRLPLMAQSTLLWWPVTWLLLKGLCHAQKCFHLFSDFEPCREQMGPTPSSKGSFDIALSSAHT